MESLGWAGSVRRDSGDYLYTVYANVAPVSKLDFVTERRETLAVALDANGLATHELQITWQNNVADKANALFRAVPGNATYTLLGQYVRLLTPISSVLQSVAGGSFGRVTGVEESSREAGRDVFGNYLAVPPGSTSLLYRWTTAGTTSRDGEYIVYTMTIQKQPGRLEDPVAVTVTIPSGARIASTSPEMTIAGQNATLVTSLAYDVVISIHYRSVGP
jgi:hypothetical protein